MFGFGPSKKQLDQKFSSVQKDIDPKKYPSSMPVDKINEMGIQAILYDSTVNTYKNSKQKGSDRKAAYKSLKSIEKKVRKINK